MIAPRTPEPSPARPLPTATAARPRRSPWRFVLALFSSVWLGITLLALLFIYSAAGSSGVPTSINIFAPASWTSIREWRGLEMTEFEWFHWWPFDLLILLLCTNLAVTTVRRIRLKVVNLGVWMIHSGIIVLAIGSVIYFSTKVEGDSPVIRRQVVIAVPDAEPISLPAIPGASATIQAPAGPYLVQVFQTDPAWEILAEADKGKRTYAVSVRVNGPTGQFTRQLLAGYPQYTEDVVRTDDPKQPFARSKNVHGRALFDEAVEMTLLHMPQQYNYLARSAAIYVRALGTSQWHERPIRRAPNSLVDCIKRAASAVAPTVDSPGPSLPRYNEYVDRADLVWSADDHDRLSASNPLSIEVPPAGPDDPLRDVTLRVTGYLRYAQLQTRRVAGGPELDPAITVRIWDRSGRGRTVDLAALDPQANVSEGGLLHMRWASSAQEVEALCEQRDAVLDISVPEAGVNLSAPIPMRSRADRDQPFTPIEGTEYAYRVQSVQDGVHVGESTMVSVAFVEIRTPQRTFVRWVFDRPALNRDVAADGPQQAQPGGHGSSLPLDEKITMAYRPGAHPPLVLMIAGPGERDLQVVVTTPRGQQRHPATVGQTIELGEGTRLQVLNYAPHTFTQTRPAIIPRAERDRQLEEQLSMIRVEAPGVPGIEPAWLRYHHYAFTTANETLRRYPYRPTLVRLADGRMFEVLFSRRRVPLPAAVVLDDFELKPHPGGFTGENLSIRDWISVVRFETSGREGGDTGAGWSDRLRVSVNQPAEFRGFWFFQSFWDPPMGPREPGDVASSGLNYTVLGVGNRRGVNVQLAGCCIAVLGMLYAFYVKPTIKRRRQQRVTEQLERGEIGPAGVARDRLSGAAGPVPAVLGDAVENEMEDAS